MMNITDNLFSDQPVNVNLDGTHQPVCCCDCGKVLDGYYATDRHNQTELILTCRSDTCLLKDTTREVDFWVRAAFDSKSVEVQSYRNINLKARQRAIAKGWAK